MKDNPMYTGHMIDNLTSLVRRAEVEAEREVCRSLKNPQSLECVGRNCGRCGGVTRLGNRCKCNCHEVAK